MPDGGNPNFTEMKQLVDETQTLFSEFQKKVDERIGALEAKEDPVRKEEIDRINAELSANQEKLDNFAASLKRRTVNLDGKEVDVEELDHKAMAWAEMRAKARGRAKPEEFTHENLLAYKRAFAAHLREDVKALDPEHVKALSVGSDPDGGYVVDPDTSGRISQKIFETSPIRRYASVQLISTDALEGLYDNEEAGFGWVSETGSRTETTTPQLGRWRIPIHEIYAEPRATQKLVDDAMIDMEAWLQNKVADRFARAENAAFVSGDGVGKPRGITTYPDYASPGVFELDAIEQFDTGANGDFASDPHGFNKLIEIVYATKAPYRANSVWFCNRTTVGKMRMLSDSEGQKLWQPSIAAGQPSTLLGYPVAEFEDMPDYSGTGNLALGFGDLGAAYQIVDRIGIRVIVDVYTAKPFIKYYTTARVGGDVVNFEAIKLLAFKS